MLTYLIQASLDIIERKDAKSIEAEWLEFLYDEVLVYYETDGRDFSGFHLDKNPFLTNLQAQLGFQLIDDMKNVQEGHENVFYFKNSKGAKIESWFFHLRNAIAHNRIFVNTDDGSIILQDAKSGNLSMYGEIVSFEKLKDIITGIKNNYKNEKQQV